MPTPARAAQRRTRPGCRRRSPASRRRRSRGSRRAGQRRTPGRRRVGLEDHLVQAPFPGWRGREQRLARGRSACAEPITWRANVLNPPWRAAADERDPARNPGRRARLAGPITNTPHLAAALSPTSPGGMMRARGGGIGRPRAAGHARRRAGRAEPEGGGRLLRRRGDAFDHRSLDRGTPPHPRHIRRAQQRRVSDPEAEHGGVFGYRVNLIGEHTDYSGGFVLPTTIPQTTAVVVAANVDAEARAWSASMPRDQQHVRFIVGEEARAGGWVDYVQGVSAVLRTAGHRIVASTQ